MTREEWTKQIRQDIADNTIMVYAKGEKNMAMCGFSHRVMLVFNSLGVDYGVRSIFADPELKPALSALTDWPTTPQIFIGGEFIGGCDIVEEMYRSGELQKLIEAKTAKQA
jgi:monothiol glutaredoxin